MTIKAHKCPKCKQFILEYYCHHCQIDIRDYQEIPDFLKNIFDMKGNKND